MDRREALKKLGVGGALVVSAPLLLDSFNVAHASSHVGPPTGVAAVPVIPPTPKANSVQIAFDASAFGVDPDQLTFYWDVVSATPPITVNERVVANGSVGQLTKANGNGKMGKFTIEVVVWYQTSQIATYLIVSDGSVITVTRVNPAE